MIVSVACMYVVALFFAVTSTVTASSVQNVSAGQVLNDLPSLRIHISLKRKALQIHGQSEFDIFANPIATSNSVLYDGFATFTEDDSKFTYTLVDGVTYLEANPGSENPTKASLTAQCISTNFPFSAIIPALNDATPIPSASIGDELVQCSSGNLFKVVFSGAEFAVCASGSSGFTVFGSEMDIKVEYLDHPLNISVPTVSGSTTACSAVMTATPVSATGLALLTGGGNMQSSSPRKLRAESHMTMEASKCSCKVKPRPCIFFHGLGNQQELDELQDSPKKIPTKFGDISGHTPCCSTVKYAVLNTVNYGWTSDKLQQKYCDRAMLMSNSSDKSAGIIDDTVIVTHSMGGLVMAGALATGKCSFGTNAAWVSLSPPMTGSMAVDYLQGVCNKNALGVAKPLLGVIGQCPVSMSRTSTVYENEMYSNASLNAAYTAAQEAYRGNVTSAICSNYYVGLVSMYQAPSILVGTEIPHKSKENDGLVEFQSCTKGLDAATLAKFGNSYKSQFYKPELNHADTAFLAGDGLFRDYQKPVKWFECSAIQ